MIASSAVPTVTVLTPRGRSAVAVVLARVAAEVIDIAPPLFRAANGRSCALQPLNRVCFGRWGTDPGEEVVVCRVDPERIEISCHGGVAAAARIVRDLEARGCRAATWPDVLREQHSPIAAECIEALTRCPTMRTAAIMLEQATGRLEQALGFLIGLDGPTLVSHVDDLLRWSGFGRHLTQPWQIVLTGLPNVGKSSLINRLVGYERSIVYAEPGTTRDVVTAATVFDGWPVELFDTAGLREAANPIEAEGVRRARQHLAAADLPIIVLDRSRPITAAEARLIDELPRAIVVEHKSDLDCAWTDDRPPASIPVSSATGTGIDRLIAAITLAIVPALPPPGTPIPVTPRQFTNLHAARDTALHGDLDAARRHLRRLVRDIS